MRQKVPTSQSKTMTDTQVTTRYQHVRLPTIIDRLRKSTGGETPSKLVLDPDTDTVTYEYSGGRQNAPLRQLGYTFVGENGASSWFPTRALTSSRLALVR